MQSVRLVKATLFRFGLESLVFRIKEAFENFWFGSVAALVGYFVPTLPAFFASLDNKIKEENE